MPSSSETQEHERMQVEMDKLALQKQQLRDRQAMLSMLEEFGKQSGHMQQHMLESEEAKRSLEIKAIKKQLAILNAKEVALQEQMDKILYHKSQPDVLDTASIISQGGVFVLPPITKPGIVPPPSKPAPQVILDAQDLPTTPSLMKCPACRELIITETVFRVGGTTWLVCVMCSMLGCVGGCCLIPFCAKCFKDVEHKCPKCRTRIHTVSKL
ncbi:lipopolysaccharide-induced tumor necrosis factor-alpha factor homolog [Anguilla rostrata]|uniref:lipopolysaccharide-induced tumor necrosis factor-alpha factor homolog n=1 Tax=Anguilla rostrata TaxID=7938 RepID=UPI0030D58695